MNDRDALAALVHGAVRMQDRGLLEGVDIQRIAWAATDAILAAGWRAPVSDLIPNTADNFNDEP